ncbi:MAG: hypothetical protein IOC66_17485 [Burkholderia sp.]|nr:hypothetical protein [Burkholderia sp.]
MLEGTLSKLGADYAACQIGDTDDARAGQVQGHSGRAGREGQTMACGGTTGIDDTAGSTAYHRVAQACVIAWNESRPLFSVFLVFGLG